LHRDSRIAGAHDMTSYGQFCPIAKAASVLMERWTLLILREFLCGSHRFNELERGLPGISRPLLAKRLRTLADCGIIAPAISSTGEPAGYDLTERGLELLPIVMGIGEWGQRWLNEGTQPSEIDPDLLMWDIHRRLDVSGVEQKRVVVEVDFRGACTVSYWLVIEPPTASVCHTDPGFDIDLLVTADTRTLHDVWIGRADLATALRLGLVCLDGASALRRAFPTWLQLSPFAHIPFNGSTRPNAMLPDGEAP